MSTIAYASIVGARQGAIKGNVTAAGREGTIALVGLSSQLNVPFDAATGVARGARQHHPITLTKLVDQATPKLYEALARDEKLTDVTIAFWTSPDRNGAQTPFFTIKLTDASIVGLSLSAHDAQDAAAPTPAVYQEVQLTYRKIAWTWVDGGITATDDWATHAPT